MEKWKEALNLNKKNVIIIAICIIITVIISAGIYYLYYQENNTNDVDILDEMDKDIVENNEKSASEIENVEENNKNEINQMEDIEENEDIIAIHITGEVKKPGIIYLKNGARIADAITTAGGATKDAALDKVNLAYILADGQKIYIPNKNEKEEKEEYIISNSGENILVEGQNTSINEKGESKKVNINSANQTELETLPGIGPSLAQRIIEYRNQNGKFTKIEDIQNVKGIGDAKFSNIKDYISI